MWFWFQFFSLSSSEMGEIRVMRSLLRRNLNFLATFRPLFDHFFLEKLMPKIHAKYSDPIVSILMDPSGFKDLMDPPSFKSVIGSTPTKSHSHVNFDSFTEHKSVDHGGQKLVVEKKTKYKKDNREIKYDNHTREYFRVIREQKLDPISLEPVKEKTAFCFPYQWDPYTGERLEKDPIGPLYFDPVVLAYHFYINRLRNLWMQPEDTGEGVFQGIYDDGVGSGDTFYVHGRGHHPERYLFRLPIPNCYLTKDHNAQVVTFGPKLTDDEVKDLDTKLQKMRARYRRLFRRNPPPLADMKRHYDQAIAKKPHIGDEGDVPQSIIQDLRNMKNRQAVDRLVNM